jgi:ATP-binding cassette subfamily B protein
LGTLGNRYGLWNEFLNASLLILILSLSAYTVLQKDIKIGEMMAIISIASGMIGSVGRLATTNIQLQEAKVAFERMYEFASISPEKTLKNINTNQEIETINSINIHHLSFRFAGKSQLLKNVSLTLRKGEITVLLGEVGSGKSILLQILQKFQIYEAGEILINENISLKNIASDTWRSKIGIVPQEIKIFN